MINISTEVLAVLDRGTYEDNRFFLPPNLERKLYERTNKVLEAAGGKWNKSAKAHLFPDNAYNTIEPVMLTGQVTNTKQQFGFFETPGPIVSRMLRVLNLKSGQEFLEPSAGRGAIAIKARSAGAIVTAIELQPANVQWLRNNTNLIKIYENDFLSLTPGAVGKFDAVGMNPPFAGQMDIHHVTHALKFLRPGGMLVAVMSSSVTFRSTRVTRDFRELVSARGGTIDELPEGSFKPSGTNVRTVLVKIPTY